MHIKIYAKMQRLKEKYQNWFYFWLFLSVVTAVLFSFSGLKIALKSPLIIQDDARQYLFWLQQFQDRDLFRNDLIANYFQSVTPVGFSSLYHLIAGLNIDIFLFNKLSTLILGVATSIYCFLVCVTIFPVPFAGFVSSLLLNQNLWMVDDLSSGTPRAYIYVLLLAFIYYLLKRNLFLSLLAIALQGLFYPQAVLISVFLLSIRILFNKENNKNQKIELLGLFFGIIILVIYNFKTSNFAPVITAKEAKLLPEFLPGGRSAFFSDNWLKFWLTDRRSGFFPIEWQYSLMCSYGISLWWFCKNPERFPLVKKINPNIKILLVLFLASVCLFFLAHLFLFKLHLPGRYTHHTIRIIIALIDGITIALIGSKLWSWKNKWGKQKYIKLTISILLLGALIYPTYAVQSYPERLGYVQGKSPELYQFLQQQPKNSVIATLSAEADFIPSLAARSVLVAEEYSIPYHQKYYQQLRRQTKDLITAQYSSNKYAIAKILKNYNVTLWLIERNAFTIKYLQNNQWLQQYQPETQLAISLLKDHQKPLIEKLSDRCKLLDTNSYIILDTNCLLVFLQ